MNIEHVIHIDTDAIVSELIDQWQAGRKDDVIQQLKTDHAGLTAMFIVIGCGPGGPLSVGDANEVTNLLNDDRTNIGQTALRLSATGRLPSRDPSVQNIPIHTAQGKTIREAFRTN